MGAWQEEAAANNAEWCDLVARSHGLPTRFEADAWTCGSRTPRFYPDAVTLAPEVSPDGLLARIDASAGCSVKDSFATLDLGPRGFRVLFEADWIAQAPGTGVAGGLPWRRITRSDELDRWQRAWRDGEDQDDIFRAELLSHENVAILGVEQDGDIVAGAVLNASQDVVGLSNTFTGPAGSPLPWDDYLALADSLFPGKTLVGYESGGDLAGALRHGFTPAGHLRVWVRDTP